MSTVGWDGEDWLHDKGLQKILEKFMSSSDSYGGLKGTSRSSTNHHQSCIKRFVSNIRFEWYQFSEQECRGSARKQLENYYIDIYKKS